MFPPSLAEGCFSLRTLDGPVPAMSIRATVAEDGALLDYDIMPTLIEPKARMTYVEVSHASRSHSVKPDVRCACTHCWIPSRVHSAAC